MLVRIQSEVLCGLRSIMANTLPFMFRSTSGSGRHPFKVMGRSPLAGSNPVRNTSFYILLSFNGLGHLTSNEIIQIRILSGELYLAL